MRLIEPVKSEPVKMEIKSWIPRIRQSPIIAVIRTSRSAWGLEMATAAVAGGIDLVEITWNSDRPTELVAQLRSKLPNCLVGAGTLLTMAQVREAIAAGAQFLFSPHVDSDLIQMAVEQDVPIVPGALSPSEIVHAWRAGATCVKVFPIQAVGGASYIESLQGPLGHIPLIPTGGVTLDNARDFLRAGAIAVGLSGDLFPQWAIAQGNWDEIRYRAQKLRQGARGQGE
jgi:2-dehydro-3-deoxyphosphogluconate aldolase/(4S)-4-hydroxy-2-oxoglutarate aldolase